MGVLKGFLQPSPMEETKEVIISERFTGEDGKPLPFKIRVIDQETNSELYKQSTKRKKIKNKVVEEVDNAEYANRLIVACVISPNFKDSEMCDYYKTVNPLDVPSRMLSSGEYNRLLTAISDLNEFDREDPEEIEEEAKN